MSSRPLVSVLIPIYNHANYIEACLDSVWAEDYPCVEVIALDDGSLDNSLEVAKLWRERHPGKFVRFELGQQENRGLTASLNRLVSMAQGEFITILASDDMLVSGGIDARVGALERHSYWLAVIGDCKVIDVNGNEILSSGITQLWDRPARKEALLSETLLPYEIVFRWTIPGPVLMLRRSAFDRAGYYDENLMVEDRDYYLRLALQWHLGFVDVPVALYRSHPSNSYKTPGRLARALRTMSISELKNVHLAKGFLKLVLLIDGYRLEAYYRKLTARGLARYLWQGCGLALKIVWRSLDLVYEGYRLWVQRSVRNVGAAR